MTDCEHPMLLAIKALEASAYEDSEKVESVSELLRSEIRSGNGDLVVEVIEELAGWFAMGIRQSPEWQAHLEIAVLEMTALIAAGTEVSIEAFNALSPTKPPN